MEVGTTASAGPTSARAPVSGASPTASPRSTGLRGREPGWRRHPRVRGDSAELALGEGEEAAERLPRRTARRCPARHTRRAGVATTFGSRKAPGPRPRGLLVEDVDSGERRTARREAAVTQAWATRPARAVLTSSELADASPRGRLAVTRPRVSAVSGTWRRDDVAALEQVALRRARRRAPASAAAAARDAPPSPHDDVHAEGGAVAGDDPRRSRPRPSTPSVRPWRTWPSAPVGSLDPLRCHSSGPQPLGVLRHPPDRRERRAPT